MPFPISLFHRCNQATPVDSATGRATAARSAAAGGAAADIKFISDLLDDLRWTNGNPVACEDLTRFAQAAASFPATGDFQAAVAQAIAPYSNCQRQWIRQAIAGSSKEIAMVSQDLMNTPAHGEKELRLHAAKRVDALRDAGMRLRDMLKVIAEKASEPDITDVRPVSFDPLAYQQRLNDFVDGVLSNVDQHTLFARFERLLAAGGAKAATPMSEVELDGYHASIELAMARLDSASLGRVLNWFDTQPIVLDGRRPAPAKGAAAARPSTRTALLALCRRDEDYAARELAKLRIIAQQVATRRLPDSVAPAHPLRDLANRFTVFASATNGTSATAATAAVQHALTVPCERGTSLLRDLADASTTVEQYGRAWLTVAPEACAGQLESCHRTLSAILRCASQSGDPVSVSRAITLVRTAAPILTRLTDFAALKSDEPSTSSGRNAQWEAEVQGLVREIETAVTRAGISMVSESTLAVTACIPDPDIDRVPPLVKQLASASTGERERASAEVDNMIGHIERMAALRGASELARHDMPMFNSRVATFLRMAGHLLNDDQLRRLSRCEGIGMPMRNLCDLAKMYRDHLRLCLEADTPPELATALANATRGAIRLCSDTLLHGGTHKSGEAREIASQRSGPMMARSMGEMTVRLDKRQLGRLYARLQTKEFQALSHVLYCHADVSPYDVGSGSALRLSGNVSPDTRLLAGMAQGASILQIEAASAVGKSVSAPGPISEARWDQVTSYLCGSGKVLDTSQFWELDEPDAGVGDAGQSVSRSTPQTAPLDRRDSSSVDPARSQLVASRARAEDWEDSWNAEEEVVISEEPDRNWINPDANHNADMRSAAREALRDMMDAARVAVRDALGALTQWESRTHRPGSNMLMVGRNRDIYIALHALRLALQRIDTSILRPAERKVIEDVIRNDEWTVDGFSEVARILTTVSSFNAQYLDKSEDQSILNEVQASTKALIDVINLFDKKRPSGPNQFGFRFRNEHNVRLP